MNSFYMVCFYKQINNYANVKFGGLYNNKNDALNRISSLFGNVTPNINNTLISENGQFITWVNEVNVGDNNNFNLNINQPFNSISL